MAFPYSCQAADAQTGSWEAVLTQGLMRGWSPEQPGAQPAWGRAGEYANSAATESGVTRAPDPVTEHFGTLLSRERGSQRTQ